MRGKRGFRYLRAAQNPVILVDTGAIRHRALDVIHDVNSKLRTVAER